MHQHPDLFLRMIQNRVNAYDRHAAIHLPEAQSTLRARRGAAVEERWFRLQYRIRSLVFRLVPHIARRLAL